MRRQLIEKSIVRTVMSDTPCENWTFISPSYLPSTFARSVFFPAATCELECQKCESCARVNTIHLNPIILADYWLDSVCSLCRWSRLTLSLPCLVRLHIYIINYITLLIIIFTPSRSHATPHRNPDADARDTRHYAPRIVSCRMRDCTKAKKRKEMENASEENRPDLCFFFPITQISLATSKTNVYTHETNTPTKWKSFSYDCHVRDLRFQTEKMKRRKDLFLLPRFFIFFISFHFFLSFIRMVFFSLSFFLFGKTHKTRGHRHSFPLVMFYSRETSAI